MISLLAPSKTMDFTTPAPGFVKPGQPLFAHEAEALARKLQDLTVGEMQKLMQVSEPLAKGTVNLYEQWGRKQKPALWAYKGDVYKGVKADELTQAKAEWAQENLLILSGLYGILRPYDEISAYRLEMKAKLSVGETKNSYEFWGDKLAKVVAERANGVVCVLSSDEYARAVLKYLPRSIRVVTPIFYDNKPNGKVGVAPIYSKMMRGVMARWVIDNRAETPEDLKRFTAHGYAYDASRSREDFPAFYREEMKPLVF